MSHTRYALDSSVLEGLRTWRIWSSWALADIKKTYRRSVIGPFWQSLNLAVTIVGLGLVFSWLWRMEIRELLPYLCAGLILWTLLTGMVNEGCHVFIAEAGTIKSINLPLPTYVFRLVSRHYLIFLHNIVVYVPVAIYYDIPFGFETLLVIPGLAIYAVNGVWVGLLLGLLSARFRDVPLVVQNFMQLCFFITPIFWKVEALGSMQIVAHLNIFFHYIDIVRLPMLGHAPLLKTWLIVLGVTAIGSLISLFFFARFRRRSVGWL